MELSKLNKVLLLTMLGTFTVWSFQLPGINISGLGTMFPLRIFTFIVGSYFLLCRLKSDFLIKTKRNLLILLLYGLVSLVWCIDTKTGLSTLIIYITSIFTVFSTFVLVKNNDDIIFLAKVISINAIVVGCIGIYESITGNFFWSTVTNYENSWMVNSLGLKYPHSIFYNTNDFASFMVAMLPIFCIAVQNIKFKSVLQYIAFMFCTFCVILTNSRMCLILCVLFFMYLIPKKSDKAIVYACIIVITTGIIVVKNWETLSSSFSEITTISFKEEDRFGIWTNCFYNVFRSKFIGVGIGNTLIANQNYYIIYTNDIYAAHNYFLEILLEFGIVGFLCFTSWFIGIFKGLYKIKNSDEITKFLKCFLLLYVFLSICSSSIRQAYYFWLLLALCIVKIINENEK